MMPPLASSLPEIGRKRTETSTSANFWSSSRAMAHGWVSAVWAKTWRPPDARRTHWPATNFHFGFSTPRSYFMAVLSSAAQANAAVASSSAATMIFMGPLLLASIQIFADDFPLVAAHQCDLRHGATIVETRCGTHSAISRIRSDRQGRRLGERPLRPVHRLFLGASRGEISVVADRDGLAHDAGAVVDDDLHERVPRSRSVLRGVDRQLERAIVDLVHRRQGCSLAPADDQTALER